jgi:hypothetical protein
MVLLLIAVAAIAVGAALQRSAAQSLIVSKQIDGYRNHHEMLGIADYCRWWIGKRENDAKALTGFARSGEAAHRLVLDNNVVVLISIKDGQGTVLRSLTEIGGSEQRRWLVEILSRLPANRPDLTRRSGGALISLNAAPDEVLDALAAYDTRTVVGLREARAKGVANTTEFQQALERHNVESMVIQTLTTRIAFEPTLWRMNVEVIHPDRVNRYTLLAEKKANLTKLQEWRPVGEGEAERLFGMGLSKPTGGAQGF